jgi:beta-glucosidase/6-phospho-beta-glucosidase/beta-galactosidase
MENGTGAFDDKSKPMIIDKARIQYLHDHINEVVKAKKLGCNVIGYSM